MKAEPRVSVRVSPELKQRLENVVKQTGIDEATIVRNCIEAVCVSVNEQGHLVFPLKLVEHCESARAPGESHFETNDRPPTEPVRKPTHEDFNKAIASLPAASRKKIRPATPA